jgi:hypothetical protein
MLKHIYLSLLLLISTGAFAQNIQSRKADSLYAAKSYAAAGTYYLLAAGTDEFKASKRNEYYNAACCYSLSGKADSAMILLKKRLKMVIKTARI